MPHGRRGFCSGNQQDILYLNDNFFSKTKRTSHLREVPCTIRLLAL